MRLFHILTVLLLFAGLTLSAFAQSTYPPFKGTKTAPSPVPTQTQPRKTTTKSTQKAAPLKIRQTTANKIRYYALNDIAKAFGMSCSMSKTTAVMTNGKIRLSFTLQKRLGAYNGNSFALLFAPFSSRSLVWISQYDYQLILRPMLNARNMTAHKIKTICLDPGHGGTDPGCCGAKSKEKDITLAIALTLRRKLQAKGYTVVMTRTSDKTLTLDQRTAIANKAKADLFISIHCNAVKSKSIRGVESYALTPRYCASSSDNTRRATAYNGNAYDKNNFRLAYEMQRSLRAATSAPDRGVKHARFVVIRDVKCPAALLEVGFLTHAKEEKSLLTSTMRERIATQLCEGVLRYHKAVKR